MSPYPQAASSLVVRPPDLQRWPDYTYLVATRTTEPALTLSRTKAAVVPEKRVPEEGVGEAAVPENRSLASARRIEEPDEFL